MKCVLTILLTGTLAHVCAASEPPGQLLPAVSIRMGQRHGHVTPCRQGFAHTGGGTIDVAQPLPDTIVITMSGVAVAGGHPLKDSMASLQFDLDQCFDVICDDPKPRPARITLEGRVIGLLRSHCHGGGTAEHGPACVSITSGAVQFADLCVPAHSVQCGHNLSLNCREGPTERKLLTGVRYNLHQSLTVCAKHPAGLFGCKAAAAEFAPDPALDPLWISYWEPFHGAAKKDFGFQLILRVAPTDQAAK